MAKTKNNRHSVSYILAYTLKTVKEDRRGRTQDHFSDHYEVFCEYDENENTPAEQAKYRLNEIMAMYEDEDSVTEVYCWNICQIVKTSEHYPV